VKRFSRWCDRNPLLAVWLGFVAVLLIMIFIAPHLLVRASFTTT
jgi:hypothetical protein